MTEQNNKFRKSHNRSRNNYNQQGNINDGYDQHDANQNRFFSNKKILFVIVVVIVVVAALVYKATSRDNLSAKILSVEPNYKTIKVENKDCHNVSSHVQVKNPERTFWNGMFDSSKYPKYITKETPRVVCHDSYTESQVLQYYTVKYQIKNAVDTIIVRNTPPLVNTEITLAQLQSYMESSSITVGVLNKESQ